MSALLIAALALGLRLWGLEREPLWGDEIYSQELTSGSVGEIIDGCVEDVHPPAYYLGLRTWRLAFGGSPAGIRSYSLAWSLLGVLIVGLLAAELSGRWQVGMVASALAAINPQDIYFAQETRMYAQASTLGAISTLLLWHWLRGRQPDAKRPGAPSLLLAYSVTASLLILTHYLGALILLAQGVFALLWLLKRRDGRGVSHYVGASIVALLLCAPWLIVLIRGGGHDPTLGLWRVPPPVYDLFIYPLAEFFYGSLPRKQIAWYLALLLPIVPVLVTVVSAAWPRNQDETSRLGRRYLLWMMWIPVALAFIASHTLQPILFRPRLAMFVLPYFLVLVSLAWFDLRNLSLKRIYLGSIVALMLAGTVLEYRLLTKHEYKAAGAGGESPGEQSSPSPGDPDL